MPYHQFLGQTQSLANSQLSNQTCTLERCQTILPKEIPYAAQIGFWRLDWYAALAHGKLQGHEHTSKVAHQDCLWAMPPSHLGDRFLG